VKNDAAESLWLIDTSVENSLVRITAFAPPTIAEDKSLELWLVRADDKGVTSLGLLPLEKNKSFTVPLPETDGIAYAVSLEPSGGSPEQAPTGPVLYQATIDALTI